jgi:dimethylargininase
LTHLIRTPIDVERARAQHAQYEAALKGLDVAVLSLPEEPTLPDSVFVEDTALVLDECAIITRPGADSRRPETESIAKALAPYRKLLYIEAPARVDGGDVLRVGKNIYVGLSTRSDPNAVEQIQDFLQPYGYETHAVSVTGCLHLKSAVTQVREDMLLLNPQWVKEGDFEGVKFIEVDPSEAYAANAVMVGGTIIYPTAFPRTQNRLEAAGIKMVKVDADELAKAEGAVTCCSLIFDA